MPYFPNSSIAGAVVSFGIATFSFTTLITKGNFERLELKLIGLIAVCVAAGVGFSLHAVCSCILLYSSQEVRIKSIDRKE